MYNNSQVNNVFSKKFTLNTVISITINDENVNLDQFVDFVKEAKSFDLSNGLLFVIDDNLDNLLEQLSYLLCDDYYVDDASFDEYKFEPCDLGFTLLLSGHIDYKVIHRKGITNARDALQDILETSFIGHSTEYEFEIDLDDIESYDTISKFVNTSNVQKVYPLVSYKIERAKLVQISEDENNY